MPGRIPTAKVPELRVQPEFCDGAPFSLGFKRNRIIGTHIFLNYLESGRLKIRFWFLCFWSSFSLYILISLRYSLFKKGEIWVELFQISLADASLL